MLLLWEQAKRGDVLQQTCSSFCISKQALGAGQLASLGRFLYADLLPVLLFFLVASRNCTDEHACVAVLVSSFCSSSL
jgi:hypothetical protein